MARWGREVPAAPWQRGSLCCARTLSVERARARHRSEPPLVSRGREVRIDQLRIRPITLGGRHCACGAAIERDQSGSEDALLRPRPLGTGRAASTATGSGKLSRLARRASIRPCGRPLVRSPLARRLTCPRALGPAGLARFGLT